LDATLDWLLEAENPSARALALSHLAGRLPGDPEVEAAQAAIPGWGPARDILAAQWPAGYWMAPGPGYSPKHKATVWQVIFLAALGAPCTGAIDAACAYVLEHSRRADGRFSAGKTAGQATADLNGSLLRALGELGYHDPSLFETAEGLARMVLRPWFRAPAGRKGQGACLATAARALGGLAAVPPALRSPAVVEAMSIAAENLLSEGGWALLGGQGAEAENGAWQRLCFPPGDTADLLEAVEALQAAGYGADPRLDSARELVWSKQDRDGRWVLERVPHNTWASFGQVDRPNKWVTIRALRAMAGGVGSPLAAVGVNDKCGSRAS
jgi:hypothetical protein